MIPDETGRYCNSCKKSVIDFTAKTDEEIQDFFINNFSQPVCARFKNTQIHRIVIDLPKNIFSTKMPLWMRFLVACLIIFGISIFPFETTIAGKAPTTISYYQGEPAEVKKDKKPRVLKKKKRKKFKKPDFLLQDIIWVTMGYMPTPLPGPPIYSTIFDSSSKSNLIADTQIGLSNEPIPQKEQPRPTPFIPSEFILPSILLFRKENNNQTID
jgi:hypothetical protein